ncbi:MAG: class B sortase [Clostridiales bacterium]|jgi:sortase B|nr:class B sortase [Clostridiales bacterium]
MKKKRIIINIGIILAVIVLAIFGWKIYSDLNERHKEEVSISKAQEMKPSYVNSGVDANTPDIDQTSNVDNSSNGSIDKINSDVIGWLTIPDTVVDYAVVQTTDNDYYLHYDVFKQENKLGAPFLDYRVNKDFSGFNNVIYGHNIDYGPMFHDVMRFKESDFFNSHTTAMLYTPAVNYKLDIFAVATTTAYSNYYKYAFASPAEKNAQLQMIKNTALFYRDIGVTIDDHILTLSGCSWEYDGARTVLLCRMDPIN